VERELRAVASSSCCSRRPLRIVVVLAAALAVAAPLAAQEPPATPPAEDGIGPDREATGKRRGEVAAQIAELRTSPGADLDRLALLERLERQLSQSLDEFERGEKLGIQLDAVRQELAQPPGDRLGDGPPYSVSQYDAVREEHEAAQRVLEDLEKAAGEASAALEVARDSLEEAERERRAARETLGAETAPDLLDLRVDLADAALWLRRQQADNARSALAAQKLQVSNLREVAEWAESRVVPRDDELAERVARLDAEAAALSRQREQAELQLEASRRRWEQLASRPSTGEPDAGARAELAARRAEFSAFQKQVALLGERLDRLGRAQELLRRRFAVHAPDGPDRAELARWDEESRAALESLEREIRLDQAERAAFTQELRSLEVSLGTGPERPWRERQLGALRNTVAAYDANLVSLEDGLRRERQLRDSLGRPLGSLNLAERAAQLGSLLAGVWRFEITSSEDRSITVGKIATGLLVFLLGLLLARGFTHWFGPRALSRVRLDEGAAHAYQSLGYYALLAIAFITALRVVDIPLTAFAVVGGALAIGVGFGSQNVVNNFISGLILLAERPIKRGDLVELEGTYGNIERIGLRSTIVRTGDNIHVIVPNSAFLENRVINWTHNDRKVRIRVTVGVVYGSPTREVEKLIRQAIDEHPQVIDKPEPIILFTEFGDNSLNFEARFWVVISSLLGRLRIESELRYRIDDLFRAADIVIAFPQRDVHLDAVAPIPVRLLNGRDDAGAGA
jgi:small-conductance mechanosensitive channel